MRALLIVTAFVTMLFGANAATASCLTLPEARQAFPGRHLWWHGNHCWSDLGIRHADHVPARVHVPIPIPKERPDISAAPTADETLTVSDAEVPEPPPDWTDRWPDDIAKAKVERPHLPPSESNMRFLLLTGVAVLVVGAFVDVAYGNRIFNRRHSRAVRDGYYT